MEVREQHACGMNQRKLEFLEENIATTPGHQPLSSTCNQICVLMAAYTIYIQ